MTVDGPLTGVRIVEMDAIGPVPLAGMILSGLGAEIVRVRRPGSGKDSWNNMGASILHRGRTHLELNLKDPADRDALLDIVRHADALMEGARPGVMERLGLGPEDCLAINPALVYGRMTGWGQDGPLARTAGHDINYIALTGALHAIGPAKGTPVVPLNLVGDYGGGTMFLALGMVSAVLHARATGVGQVVDAAMVDGVTSMMAMFHAFLDSGQWRDKRGSNLLDGGAPFYRCYACADGKHVAVGALEPQFFAQLLDGLGIDKARFSQGDPSCWPAMATEFETVFASRSRDEWAAHFEGTDACVAPVLSLQEARTYPANQARAVFTAVGDQTQPSVAPRFSVTPGGIAPSEVLGVEDVKARWSR